MSDMLMPLRGGPRSWTAVALVATLSVGASFTAVLNDFIQDDVPIIVRNPAVHQLSGLPAHFQQPYWPQPFSPYLYRPLSSALFTIEWAATGARGSSTA
jgi:hypothetical protein